MIKFVIAVLLSVALIHLGGQSPETLTNVVSVHKEQAVQAATPEKVEEKAPTEPQAEIQPEIVAETPQLSSNEELMQEAGIPQSEWAATDYIVSHESSWNPSATNAESGAHGLCQALPASKMASAGTDYMSNPVTQLKWCHEYATSRYGSWWNSFAFWKSNRWW